MKNAQLIREADLCVFKITQGNKQKRFAPLRLGAKTESQQGHTQNVALRLSVFARKTESQQGYTQTLLCALASWREKRKVSKDIPKRCFAP